MATSGSIIWNLDIDDMIQEASEHIGGEHISARELQNAKRSLNLLLREISNKEIPLGHIKEKELSIQSSTATYNLPTSVIAVLSGVIHTSTTSEQTDLSMERMSFIEYQEIANKTTRGRPTQYATIRENANVSVNLYPTPTSTERSFKYYAITKPDTVTSYTETLDMADRYLPAICMGLAYRMGLKRDGVPPEKLMLLKSEYTQLLEDAFEEDRERVSIRVLPDVSLRR